MGKIISINSIKTQLYSLKFLRDSDNLTTDDGSKIEFMKNIESDIVRRIMRERSNEKRAGDISRKATQHIDNKGRVFFQTRAKGRQIKRSDYIDLLIELCKVYFPDENINLNSLKKRVNTYSIRAIGDRWIRSFQIDDSIRGQTFGNYRILKGKYDKFIRNSDFAEQDIRKVQNTDLYAFYKDLCMAKSLSETVFNSIVTVLSYIFNEAVLMGVSISANPMAVKNACKKKRVLTFNRTILQSKKDTKIWTHEEHDRIIAECRRRDDEYSRMIEVKFATLTRGGELSALKKDVVDFQNGLIDICRSIVLQKVDGVEKSVCVNHTKCKSEDDEDHTRLIPFDVNGRIGRILKEQCDKRSDDEYLFSTTYGEPVSCKYLSDALRDICRSANVPYYPPHRTRFYGISVLREQGVPEETIMTYTGQRTREMVNHYDRSRQFGAHRDDEKIRRLLA